MFNSTVLLRNYFSNLGSFLINFHDDMSSMMVVEFLVACCHTIAVSVLHHKFCVHLLFSGHEC